MSNAYDLDYTTLDFFSHAERKGEAALYDTKWWSYRMLHPMEATELFESIYRQELKASRERTRSVEGSSYSRHLHYPHFLENSKHAITGIWNARRAIDSIGVPYDFYCRAAFKFAERRNYKYMPTPAQIVSQTVSQFEDTCMFESVHKAWEAKLKKEFQFSEHDYYTTEQFTGSLAQCQHRARILSHIAKSPHKPLQIYTFCYEKRLIEERLIEAKFGEKAKTLIRQAKEYIEEDEL